MGPCLLPLLLTPAVSWEVPRPRLSTQTSGVSRGAGNPCTAGSSEEKQVWSLSHLAACDTGAWRDKGQTELPIQIGRRVRTRPHKETVLCRWGTEGHKHTTLTLQASFGHLTM